MRLLNTCTLLALFALAGCQSLGLTQPDPDPQLAQQRSQLLYPDKSERGEPLDIVLRDDGPLLHLTNLTPHTYDNVQIWLNRQYVHPVDHIAIGSNTPLKLVDFINHDGEAFPIGGFLAPDKRREVLLAELYAPDTGQRHHLLVEMRLRPDEQD